MKAYDVAVLGLGGMGSAALWELARRGAKVVGVERFTVGHARGSSHGDSRLIRQAYFERPDYVPLLKQAYAGWDAIESESGATLFTKNGLVLFGREDDAIVAGALTSAKQYDIPVELVRGAAMRTRFGFFQPEEHDVAVYEAGAGWLAVETAIRSFVATAQRRGADVRQETTAKIVPGGLELQGGERILAEKLVVTAGAWMNGIMPELAAKIVVKRAPICWFTPKLGAPVDPALPCFGFASAAGFFYGFPPIGGRGLKIGLHRGGDVVVDPLQVDRGKRSEDESPLEAFVARALPHVTPRARDHSVCMYEMTPDEHFIVDTRGGLAFAAGMSGHGYKFAPAIGAILADLALTGETAAPIDFLRWRW